MRRFYWNLTSILFLLWVLFNISVVVITLSLLKNVNGDTVNNHLLNLAKAGNWISVSWYILFGTFFLFLSIQYLRRPTSSLKNVDTLGLYAKSIIST